MTVLNDVVAAWDEGDRVRGAQGDPRFAGLPGVVGRLWSVHFPGVYWVRYETVDHPVRVRWDHMMSQERIDTDPDYRALYERRVASASYEYPRSL